MSSPADIATQCVNDILARAKATGKFGAKGDEKVFFVYAEEDLFNKAKLVKFPAVGIMYEGIRSNGKDSGTGMASDCYVAIAVLVNAGSIGAADQKNEAASILDALRDGIKLSKAPSSHKWKFVSETPAGEINGALVYVQRWSCPVILTN